MYCPHSVTPYKLCHGLLIFADAIRVVNAEAKMEISEGTYSTVDAIRVVNAEAKIQWDKVKEPVTDAIRVVNAEAKTTKQSIENAFQGCNPRGKR